MKTWYGRFTWQKYLVRTNFFYGTLFFLWYKWGLSPLFFFLADANFPTDNPSHTDKPCLLWIRPIQITSGVCLSSNVTMIDLEKRKRYSFHQADQIILKPPNVISQIRFLVLWYFVTIKYWITLYHYWLTQYYFSYFIFHYSWINCFK